MNTTTNTRTNNDELLTFFYAIPGDAPGFTIPAPGTVTATLSEILQVPAEGQTYRSVKAFKPARDSAEYSVIKTSARNIKRIISDRANREVVPFDATNPERFFAANANVMIAALDTLEQLDDKEAAIADAVIEEAGMYHNRFAAIKKSARQAMQEELKATARSLARMFAVQQSFDEVAA